MENNYFYYLNLPFKLNKPDYLIDEGKTRRLALTQSKLDKKLISFLDKLNLDSGLVEAFYTAPNDKIFIHCDSPTFDNHVKLNFTWGDMKSSTRWWKVKSKDKLIKGGKYYDDGNPVLHAKEEDCDLICEAVIDKPTLLNVGMLHSTYNPTNFGRWTLCIVPTLKGQRKMIPFKEAVKIFKKYLYTTNN